MEASRYSSWHVKMVTFGFAWRITRTSRAYLFISRVPIFIHLTQGRRASAERVSKEYEARVEAG